MKAKYCFNNDIARILKLKAQVQSDNLDSFYHTDIGDRRIIIYKSREGLVCRFTDRPPSPWQMEQNEHEHTITVTQHKY